MHIMHTRIARAAERLQRTTLDAGGPLMILLIVGVPLLLVAIIVGLVVAVALGIRRERRRAAEWQGQRGDAAARPANDDAPGTDPTDAP